jgi:hypothetical protein
MFQEDAGGRLVDLLPARTRALDETFDEILLLQTQRRHSSLQCLINLHPLPKAFSLKKFNLHFQ